MREEALSCARGRGVANNIYHCRLLVHDTPGQLEASPRKATTIQWLIVAGRLYDTRSILILIVDINMVSLSNRCHQAAYYMSASSLRYLKVALFFFHRGQSLRSECLGVAECTTRSTAHRCPSMLPVQVSSLEERYGGGKMNSSSRKRGEKEDKRAKKSSPPDIDNAEFERVQRKLEEGRSKR